MRTVIIYSLTISMILFIGLPGCSDNPVDPGLQGPSGEIGQLKSLSGTENNHQCMGLSAIYIDTETLEIEAVPARTSAIHLNVTGILNATMGVTAAGVPAEHDPANGIFVFDITLTHPFAAKPQFAGFDVKGILITPGSLDIDSCVFADSDETLLLNADGYTRWWNPTEFTNPGMFGYVKGSLTNALVSDLTSTVNPYKYFADILYPDQNLSPVHGEPMDSDGGRGVFSAGESNTRRYRIKFPMNPGLQVVYGYAVDASWAAPTPNPPTEIPDDFPMNANEPEPYDVTLQVTLNTLYNDSESGFSGGLLRLRSNVYDWQGQDAGDIAAEVASIKIFSPGLLASGIDLLFSDQNAVRAQYTVDLSGTAKPSYAGEIIAAVKVESAGGPSYNQGVGPAPAENIASWNAIPIEVIDPECTADPNNDWIEAEAHEYGDIITGQLCVPTDYKDFYTFTIPQGLEASGKLLLWCDLSSGRLEIYGMDHVLISGADLASGSASIDLEPLDLMPGQYYIRIYSTDDTFPAPYAIEFTGDLLDVSPTNAETVTPPGLYCDPRVVFLEGDTLYLAGMGGLWIFDIANPSNPELISYTEVYMSPDVTMYGNCIYYTEYEESDLDFLSRIDITDPEAPVVYHNILYFGYSVERIIMNSQDLYVVCNDFDALNSTVTVYQWAADPMNLTQVGQWNGGDHAIQDVALYDPEGPATGIVVATTQYLYAWKVEDPSTPVFVGTYHPSVINSIDISGSTIYCTGNAMAVTNGIFSVGYSEALGLVPKSADPTPGLPRDIYIKFPYAFIADGSAGLTVFDVTDDWNMTQLASVPLVSNAGVVSADGDNACILADNAGFELFDVSTPATPVSVYLPQLVNTPRFPFLDGKYMIVNDCRDTYSSLKVLDIENPENTHLAATLLPTSCNADYLDISTDGFGAICGGNNWALLDTSDPLNITEIASGVESDACHGVRINGDALYVMHTDRIETYDFDPLPPVYKSTTNLPNDGMWMEIEGDYMYVTVDFVYILSLLDPYSPSLVSYHIPGSIPMTLDASGDFLYVGGYDRLEIVDIGVPTSPELVGSVLTSNPPYMAGVVTASGQYAYVTGTIPTMACSIWPPDDPQVAGIVHAWDIRYSMGLAVRDNYLFECGMPYGLQIYRLY